MVKESKELYVVISFSEKERRKMKKKELFRDHSEDPGFKNLEGLQVFPLQIFFLYTARYPPNYRNLLRFKWIKDVDEF